MIIAENLSKSYDGKVIIKNLSFQIKKGSIVGFLGANGAGKSTTLKMIVGISEPDAGEISFDGKTIRESDTKRHIGFMPEVPSFYEYLTGKEFIEFCYTLSTNDPKFTEEKSNAIFQKMGIFDARNLPIREYSKGMRQRLAFAQAIIHDPEYIILDEPLDGLDPIGRKAFKKYIKDLKNQGKTIFFSSHILFDAEELCDEIIILNKGELIYQGNITNFCKGNTLEKQFVDTLESLEK